MTDRPNILIICTDQQRWDTLGATGNPFVNTPDIDALYDTGAVVEQAYCQSPVCTPSRSGFMTGRYPSITGAYQNGQDIDDRERLLSRILADHGYTCGLSGKLHLSACNPSAEPIQERRIDDGFRVFNWSHQPASSCADQAAGTVRNHAPNWPLNDYNLWLAERDGHYDTVPHPDCAHIQIGPEARFHQTTFCAERAISFIEAHQGSKAPWMFQVNIFDPHHPFDPPAEYLDRYLDRLDDIPLPDYAPGELDDKPRAQKVDHNGAYGGGAGFAYDGMSERDHRYVRAAYFAMCDLISDQVGRMVAALDATGQRQDTLVVFMSDHGELLGDHGIYLKGPFFYEPSVHVPLAFNWPGQIAAQTVSELVELTDLVPTLLDAAGIEIEYGIQGRSLWPLLSGTDAITPRQDIYCEYYNAMPWHDRDGGAWATMVRSQNAKIVVDHGHGGGELYDLDADPGEHRNLWDAPEAAALKTAMLVRLSNRMAGTIDPRPRRRADW
ncbi:sulfatase family protein [Martelella endophytica]|uniref:Sulfatase n=1 Tax=Martelella endophytica TaxID=1486262 RepID=A0A0D5LTU6_MAREN|nr:sulfatase-like hydrolase/transferase [Martelella endophytica]AJY46798.1 sulfatase [Martelella endophytica]